MAGKGLTFAATVSRDEAAYQAIYQALAAYDIACRRAMATAKK
jgi:hypothetical protein